MNQQEECELLKKYMDEALTKGRNTHLIKFIEDEKKYVKKLTAVISLNWIIQIFIFGCICFLSYRSYMYSTWSDGFGLGVHLYNFAILIFAKNLISKELNQTKERIMHFEEELKK